MPAMPQAMPNNALPSTKSMSNLELPAKGPGPGPSHLAVACKGRSILLRAYANAGTVTAKAPPITNAKLGSHSPAKVRNPITLYWLVIPEAPRPKPKIKPEASGTMPPKYFMVSNVSTSVTAESATATQVKVTGGIASGAIENELCVPLTSSFAFTVMNPNAMNVHTATKLRTLNRASPTTPWPLVQPQPRRVPTPPHAPAKAYVAIDSGIGPGKEKSLLARM
mmetsp:Transcript_67329/g.161420  ORF Transcript_67329/g.161420 Transcript_67329/m.161420 type:complete len:223 (+) Transcript_67329:398-1066(+)